MARTPEEYLPILAQALNDRLPKIRLNRRYANGDAPLPEMGANTRASWIAFQKKARTNFGGLACASLAGRILPNGVVVGDEKSAATVAARRVWRDNRLAIVFRDAVWNALTTSVGYLVTGVRDGQPIITSEDPEESITIPDALQPWRASASLKATRDKQTGMDTAIVTVPGMRQRFIRSATNSFGTPRENVTGNWVPDGDVERFDGGVPAHVLDNKDLQAEFEAHTDVIDRINLGKLQRLVTTAMQAYKQRAIKGGLPAKDEDGNDIDWAEVFEPAPGALWDLPEGIDVWESSATDIRPLLEGEKTDARDFAAVSQTPMSVFIPDGENQSATGAANSKEGEISKAKDRIDRFRSAMEASLLEALRLLELDGGDTVQVMFAPPEHVSFNEKAQAATQAKASGLASRTIARTIWGMTPEEIRQNERDLAAEQLASFTAAATLASPAASERGTTEVF